MILGEIHKLYREAYYANPLYDVSHIYMKPTLFKSITRFEPEVFVEQLLQPLFGVCEYIQKPQNANITAKKHYFL